MIVSVWTSVSVSVAFGLWRSRDAEMTPSPANNAHQLALA